MMQTVLEVKGLTKTFPGVKALDDVYFKLKKGSVHALVGENGAGKSTLIMVLGGIHQPDDGEIIIEGNRVDFHSAHDANKKGISVVFQELSLVPNLSIAENIFVNRQPVNRKNLIRWNQLYEETRKIMKKFTLDCHPADLVGKLSIAECQVVEILKAMSHSPKILILDEPTSSLTELETKELFKNIKKLKKEGISIIYISHHLHEIFDIADEVTVFRDGKFVCNKAIEEIDEDILVTNMVGRKISNMYGQRSEEQKIGDTFLEVRNASRYGDFQDVNFSVNAGEIVGFAGLVGAGRTELGRGLFGAEPFDEGEIVIEGNKCFVKSIKHALELGIGYLTEDRKEQGLFLDNDIKNNLVANNLKAFCNRIGFIQKEQIDHYADKAIMDFNIVTPSVFQKVGNLSGGNQQKVLVGEWFGINPRILIVDEPTRGVDVGAKSEIYRMIRDLVARGTAVILISSDLSEIIGMSDRVYVMRNGCIVGEVQKAEISEEKIIGLAAGTTK